MIERKNVVVSASELRAKPIVYIDLDGVIVDLVSEANKEWLENEHNYSDLGELIDNSPTVFANAKPIKDAVWAVKTLINSGEYEVYILSTPAWSNIDCWSQKRVWIENHIPELFKRIILTHNKDLLVGDYLIDDRLKNGAENFKGEHIHFDSKDDAGKLIDWVYVLDKLNLVF